MSLAGGDYNFWPAYDDGTVDYDAASRTTVVEADKTLVINRNIRYFTRNTSSETVHSHNSYTSIAEIPQVILKAKNIVIQDNVTNVDAWLIADNIISTCTISGATVALDLKPQANQCTQQLTINGPVIAKKLHLARTFGGNHTNDEPAELFFLSPETYLWTYSQATRYSQAITTYQRELAPRY